MWLDISVPIRPGMPTFPGDPEVRLARVAAIEEGDVCNVSKLELGVHAGTHIDAPVHFLDGASGVEAASPDVLIGPAWVADARAVQRTLDRAAIDALALPTGIERLLFRTRNSTLWEADGFGQDFVALTPDGAAAVVERGVRLVAIDYLSIAPFGDPVPTHTVLLRAGVVVVEGVDLRAIEPGPYDLACLPLRIPGCDGAPARALLRPIEAGTGDHPTGQLT